MNLSTSTKILTLPNMFNMQIYQWNNGILIPKPRGKDDNLFWNGIFTKVNSAETNGRFATMA